MTQHINDRLQISSLTSDAIKAANKLQSISRWLVLGKTLPQNLAAAASRGFAGRSAAGTAADTPGSDAEMHSLLVAKAAALERTLLLFKVLGNLQFWRDDLGPQARDQLVRYLMGALRSTAGSETEFQAACRRMSENLGALLRFMEPVSPDEDTKEEEEEGDILLTEVGVALHNGTCHDGAAQAH